jgi:hypothetical protein
MADKSAVQMRRSMQMRKKHLQRLVYESILGVSMKTDRRVARLVRRTVTAITGCEG